MRILVLNSGSSSIKFSIFSCVNDSDANATLVAEREGQLTGIGGDAPILKMSPSDGICNKETSVRAENLPQAVQVTLDAVSSLPMLQIDAVGYRVVHPGPHLREHQRITPHVLRLLDEAKEFAPLHNPESMMLIRATMQCYLNAAHYVCFDTVFHQTMPTEAQTFPLPDLYRDKGLHRYGFHGLSCESIVRQMVAIGMLPQRMVIAHLGSGCSVTALVDGYSVDNTMGLTPTGGVLMGTRSGDLDPGLVIYLMRKQPGNREEAAAAVETLLNHESGVSVLSGLANDMRQIRAAAADGNEHARLALKMFTRSITKAIGGFCWLLGGLDAIVFTGGIGEHDTETWKEVLASLADIGIELATEASTVNSDTVRLVSSSKSRTQVFVASTQEDLMIALHIQQMARAATHAS